MDGWSEFSWLVGIIEGEGCVRPVKGHWGYWKPRITVGMTDKDIIDRVLQAAGMGTVNGPYVPSTRPSRKPSYRWAIHGEDAISMMRRIRPYVSIKKSKEIDDCLVLIEAEKMRAKVEGNKKKSDAHKGKPWSEARRAAQKRHKV